MGKQRDTLEGNHCRFLMPDITRKILTEIWHHFWVKNDGEKWSRKNYYDHFLAKYCVFEYRFHFEGKNDV